MVLKNLFSGQRWRNRHREQTYGHGERGGEGEMCERVTWKLTLSYSKIHSQWELAVCLRELKQGLCISEREVQDGGDMCIPMADSYYSLTENNKIL